MIGPFLARKRDISGLGLGQCNPAIVTLWHAAQALGIEVHLLLREEARCRRCRAINGRRQP